MPQGRRELNQFWESDANALNHLKDHYIIGHNGIIRPKDEHREPTFVDWQAIEYLIHEFDYGYRF